MYRVHEPRVDGRVGWGCGRHGRWGRGGGV